MEVVQSSLIPCDTCGEFVAMLIFPDNIYFQQDFEHYVNVMMPEYSSRDIQTWIIAPMERDEGEDFPVDILKIWPKREKIFSQSGREFNQMLDEISFSHCITT